MSWDWNWLTPLGHIAVVWPLMVAIAALLVARPNGSANLRGVSIWLGSMAVASLLVGASKIAFYGWGTGIRAWNLTCFSGHSVLAMGFWPVLVALLVPLRFARGRRVAWLAGSLIGSLVGISRVQLDTHPTSEIMAGLALGLAVATLPWNALDKAYLNARKVLIAVSLTVSIGVWVGSILPNFPTERWLANWGTSLSGNDKPVHRDTWNNKAGRDRAN
ncbi:phosphatase PAP2 family protein [Lysobacter sp. GCM10012299]|uniref:phosphatase PAP2 family protein n=1 Tax=Lysobacter sp. GCM10012299 TaxID=3317333 RepID=UPI0036223783